MSRIALHRRTLIAAALALGAAPAWAAAEDGMAMGKATAPVTVVEYASVGCPHCAHWAIEVFPTFKKTYIDTGKVRFVLREMLTGNVALAQGGFLVARCAGPAKYFQVVDAVFRAQDAVERAGEAYDVLLGIAKNAGLDKARFDACLADEAATKALEARSDRAADAGVNSTPTFFVNGQRVDDHSLEALAAAIAKASPARRRR
ncbi:MAG TPA: DsbA family protein [Caulobacteraceae bacterium]|nr:DsbA family protein [Caulobacteraceae bacterium]